MNGDILAIASAPSFDPNLFVRGISVADYGELTDNDYRPLANKTVQGAYPPGSTFKMVTALAALEAGVIKPDETVWCPGHMEVGGRRFHCWKRAGHGQVDLRELADANLRRLLLRNGRTRRDREDRRHGAQAGAGRTPRPADVGGAQRADARQGLEAREPEAPNG